MNFFYFSKTDDLNTSWLSKEEVNVASDHRNKKCLFQSIAILCLLIRIEVWTVTREIFIVKIDFEVYRASLVFSFIKKFCHELGGQAPLFGLLVVFMRLDPLFQHDLISASHHHFQVDFGWMVLWGH